MGLRSFWPFGSKAKTLVPGAAVWPGIDSTVESLPVLRIHRDCASHFESGLSESNYGRMSKLSQRFTHKLDRNCDSSDWNMKCTILYDPSDHLPPTGGGRAQTHPAPAGPPIRRPVLVRDGNQHARAPRGNQFAASCVSYDSRLERPGVADCDLNTRDRNR